MKSQGRIGGQQEVHESSSSQFFSMSSLNQKTGGKFNVLLDFKSLSIQAKSMGDNNVDSNQSLSSLPVFNYDGNMMTPAFILQHERPFFSCKQKIGSESFQPRNDPHGEEQEQIMVIKPKSQFCSVCKLHFSDYLNHIKRQDHIQKLRFHNKKLKMDQLMTSFHKANRKADRRKSSFHMEMVEKKKKVRIIDDPFTFSPMVSKNSQETTNNLPMPKQSFSKFNSQKLLHY